MRVLVWLTVFAALLYGGYWYIGSRTVLNGTEAALAQLKAEGRADYSGVELHGFPSRFDLTISNPRLSSPDGQLGWQAAFVQVLALSYRPNHVIAVWPHDQTLTLGRDTLALHSSDLRASAAFTAGLMLPLEHAEIEGHDMTLTGQSGLSVGTAKMILATRQSSMAATGQDLALVLTGLAPGDKLRALIDPAGKQPALFDTAQIDMTPVFDRAVDRSVIATPLHLTALRAISGQFRWGQMSLEAKGDLTTDARGFVQGQLQVTAHDWRGIFALFQNGGLVPAELQKTLTNIFSALEKGSGEAGTLKLPLTFAGGRVLLGPIPLGPAPRF